MGFRLQAFPTAQSCHSLAERRGRHCVAIDGALLELLDVSPELSSLCERDAASVPWLPYVIVLQLGLPLVGADPDTGIDEWNIPLWQWIFEPRSLAAAIELVFHSRFFDRVRVYTLSALVASLFEARRALVAPPSAGASAVRYAALVVRARDLLPVTPRDGEGRRDHAGCTGMVAVDVLIGSEVVERARASPIERHLGWDGADHRRRMVICS